MGRGLRIIGVVVLALAGCDLPAGNGAPPPAAASPGVAVGDQYGGYGPSPGYRGPPIPAGGVSEQLKAKVKDVRSVYVVGDDLLVTIEANGFDDKGLVSSAGRRVMDIGEALQKGLPAPGGDLEAIVITPGVDRLGNTSDLNVFRAEFPIADLRAANYRNLYDAPVLNLMSRGRILSDQGEISIAAWCAEDRHLAAAADFCRKMTSRP